MRNISIAHPVANGQVCLSVEYVEGHDPNPSCFVMFQCIATAGHDMSTVINGTMMCVHLSPQVYTIVATDTMNDINTSTPPVIIYNVTVPSYYPEMSSSIIFSTSTALVIPTGTISMTCMLRHKVYSKPVIIADFEPVLHNLQYILFSICYYRATDLSNSNCDNSIRCCRLYHHIDWSHRHSFSGNFAMEKEQTALHTS